jgi:hypothetical protein
VLEDGRFLAVFVAFAKAESCYRHRRDDSGCRMVSGFYIRRNGGRGVTPVGDVVVCSFEFCLRIVSQLRFVYRGLDR